MIYWKEGGQFILDDVVCLSNSLASLTLSYMFATGKLAILFTHCPLKKQHYSSMPGKIFVSSEFAFSAAKKSFTEQRPP